MTRNVACTTLLCVMCVSGHALAESPLGLDTPGIQTSEPVRLTLVGDQGKFRVPVSEGIGTIVFLPSDVRHYEILTESLGSRYLVESSDIRLRIIPRGKPNKSDELQVYVETATEHVNLLTYVADSDDAARPRLIQKESEQQRVAAMVHTEAERRTTEARTKWEAQVRERELARERAERIERLKARGVFPTTGDACSTGPLRLCITSGEWTSDKLTVFFEVDNFDTVPHPVAGVIAYDARGRAHDSGTLLYADYATDEAGEVASIPAGGKTKAMVTLPTAGAGDFTALTLELDAPGAPQMVVAAVDDWQNNPFVVPKSKAQIEEEKREAEEKARERAAKGRLTLHVQGMYGGIWLANPLEDNKLDVTDVRGLGMRLTYGLSSLLAFEAEAVGASSGDSTFAGVDYNGQQGDLLRRATLGRVSFGGALRLSSGTFIPVMRLGLGLQGASHTAELDAGGVRMPGPEVGFEFQVLGAFGGGVDVRLGEHLWAGLFLSADWIIATTGNRDGLQSLGGGVHLGYSWKP